MARLLPTENEGWRVRLSSGEYELTLEELRQWILSGRIAVGDLVRPPTTKRWKRADNAAELASSWSERRRKEADERWKREEPVRRAEAARADRASRRNFALVGALLGGGIIVYGLITLDWYTVSFGCIVGLLFTLPLFVKR
jgi:hypothetical protein